LNAGRMFFPWMRYCFREKLGIKVGNMAGGQVVMQHVCFVRLGY